MWEPNVHGIWGTVGTVGTVGKRDFDGQVCSGMGLEFCPSERWKQRLNEMYNPGRGEETLAGPIF